MAQPIISLPPTPSAPPAPQQQQYQPPQQHAYGFYTGMMAQSSGCIAAAGAAGAVTRSRARLKPYELKSFTAAAVPVEPDANTQAGGRLAPSTEPSAEPDEDPAGSIVSFLQQMSAGLSSMGDTVKQLMGQQQDLTAVVAQQQLSIEQMAAAAAVAAAAVASSSSSALEQNSSSSHSTDTGRSVGHNPMLAALTARPLFGLPQHDYVQHMSRLTCLHRISQAAPGQQPHISMQLQDGRQVVPRTSAVDNGCNLLLITWYFCQLMGSKVHQHASLQQYGIAPVFPKLLQHGAVWREEANSSGQLACSQPVRCYVSPILCVTSIGWVNATATAARNAPYTHAPNL
jgi:hypothetical protein